MTNLTTRVRAWSDRILLTPVLRGLARPFRPLWAALAFLGVRLWRWVLRPIWRWAVRPIIWLPLRWIGLQLWRWVLRPIWRWAVRPIIWLPLRWTGLQLWRWVLRPIWSLLRWAWALLLASPWILARTLPNRGWLSGLTALALTAAVLLVPGVVNAKTPDRLSKVSSGAGAQQFGTLRPEITLNFASFAGWGIEPSEDLRREVVLKRGEAVLRVLRDDGVENAEEHYRWYIRVKLGVRNPGYLNARHITVKDARGKAVQAFQIDQLFRVDNPKNHDFDRYSQVVLFNYGTTVLFLALSTYGREPEPLTNQMRALIDSVRITP